jgi:hypothetical protein
MKFFWCRRDLTRLSRFNESKSISTVHNTLQFLLEWYNFEQNGMILKNNKFLDILDIFFRYFLDILDILSIKLTKNPPNISPVFTVSILA